ncbi:NAD(P)-dependent dehydrogenase (short-subunit alcohol dehydrogenase family) [Palleronia aestuarii]|uniref:NAD(P)-dependent dehydrogenase (Short-subunit alcohol dehydrogenase family) n=1 Tax=Palleronia aestuarii TaxID=568105 RepID=A0A2W7NZG4_9RHOB|nr:SDR family oxidoreductase [Palleronia aestuarii]PZX16602.1 NAD(P)-dependent dehydrogenase (short-subunit alcohol dehydrogenase family) [Palleronia aestuarii]
MSEARRRILVTGGSRGIGRATALLSARRGWPVALGYHSDVAAAESVVEEVRTGGGMAHAIQADVAQEADVLHLFDEAETALGGLDAVVVNAGIVAPGMPLARMEADRLRRMIDTNLVGALFCAREAARRLPRGTERPAAALVLVSSAAARLGAPFEYVDYAATKGALDTLTIGLAKELGGDNIRVNAVRPGLIETEIHASGGRPDRARELGSGVPLGRAGTAEEVAEAIVWLASGNASYATGAILDIAGGR